MDLQRLRAFVAVSEAGGVGRASVRLNLSQPAVTRQIQSLQTELDVLLFERVGRTVRLTAEGEDLLERARRILGDADALIERARVLKGGSGGLIRIGATPPMIEAVLVRFLAGQRRQNPGLQIEIIEDGGASLVSRLRAGDVDLAYVPAAASRLAGRLLYPVHVVAVVPNVHPLARNRLIEVAELAGEPLLVLRRGFGSRAWFDRACERADVRADLRLESSSHSVVLGLASAGYGIGILPSGLPRAPRGARAIPIVADGCSIGQWTMLAWDARRQLPGYAASFIDDLVRFARSAPPGRAILRAAPAIPAPVLG